MYWQLYVLPPETIPHLSPSQSPGPLAEPDADRPMHVVAAGMVSVVVLMVGNSIVRDVDVVTVAALMPRSDEFILRQDALLQ